jgi:drug/metabolite transporter (DMT)-like permease
MLIGILAGLGTGALWGLTFVAPRAVAPYGELDLAIARYLIFGLASLLLMAHPAFRPGRISARRLMLAIVLGLTGYVTYYVAAAYAVRFAGAAVPPLIIGLLPILLAIIGNWRDRDVRWRDLAPPLALILVGLALVNGAALAEAPDAAAGRTVLIGIACAVLALLVWIFYAVINARVMRQPDAPASLPWAGLQGIGSMLATLPLIPVNIALGGSGFAAHALTSPESLRFWFWALLLGLAGSWAATWLWVVASRRLPLGLSAQLIIAETLFALLYGFLFERRWPHAAEWAGGALQIAGVMMAVAVYGRAEARRRAAEAL